MRARKISRCLYLACALPVLVAAFATSDSAAASPQWYFNGELLEGSETMTNGRPPSFFTVPGLTFGCEPLPLEAMIENSMGTGTAKVTGLPIGVCFTNSSVCTIEAFAGEALPWNAHLKSVATQSYIVIEGFRVAFLFGGEECPLFETVLEITGSAGGLIDNEEETIVFSPSTFSSTGTALKAFGQKVEWKATLELQATGPHRGEELTVH
jgi:hypothetical protein